MTATAQFKKGQAIKIRPEWQDAGDDKYSWVVAEDSEGGWCKITATNATVRNQQSIETRMIEPA
jgi:hypothetical protein